MPVLDLLNRGARSVSEGGSLGGRPDHDFSLDGIVIPGGHIEEVSYKDTYRVNVIQTGAGQIGQKAGVGGCPIVVRGCTPITQAAYLFDLKDLLLDNSNNDQFMVWYDARRQMGFPVLCNSTDLAMNISKAHIWQWALYLHAQVDGMEWAIEALAFEGLTAEVDAFDIGSLGLVVADAEQEVEQWKQQRDKDAAAQNAGNGQQAPTQTGGG